MRTLVLFTVSSNLFEWTCTCEYNFNLRVNNRNTFNNAIAFFCLFNGFTSTLIFRTYPRWLEIQILIMQKMIKPCRQSSSICEVIRRSYKGMSHILMKRATLKMDHKSKIPVMIPSHLQKPGNLQAAMLHLQVTITRETWIYSWKITCDGPLKRKAFTIIHSGESRKSQKFCT